MGGMLQQAAEWPPVAGMEDDIWLVVLKRWIKWVVFCLESNGLQQLLCCWW